MRYLIVIIQVYVVIDYIATLDGEIKHMWRGRWTTVRALFFMSRYLVLIDIPLSVLVQELYGLNPKQCLSVIGPAMSLTAVGISLGEAIMFKRVHALSKQSRPWGIYLLTHWTIALITNLALSVFFIRSTKFGQIPPEAIRYYHRCFVYECDTGYWAAMLAVSLFTQLVITSLTLYFTYTNFRHASGSLMSTIYRDGSIYFVIMSAIITIAFITTVAFPIEWRFFAGIGSRVFQSTLSTRIVLRIRDSTEKDAGEPFPPQGHSSIGGGTLAFVVPQPEHTLSMELMHRARDRKPKAPAKCHITAALR